MNRNRVWLLAAVLALVIAVPAGAWEFSLKGTGTYEYEMIGQTGRNGFFGPYDVDASAGAHNFSTNFWPGFQPPGQVVGPVSVGVTSSSDARWMTQYAEFFPEFKINQAVSFKGSYYIGAWQDPLVAPGVANVYDSELVVKESAGSHTSMSPGYWNWFYLGASLPIGNFSIGKRQSRFGMGLIYDGYTAASESVSLSAPYGPLTIGLSFYPARRDNHGATFSPVKDDGSNIRAYNITWGATYSDGPLQTGFAISHVDRWRPAERVASVLPTSSRSRQDLEANGFLKYNNGRFFFNAEIDWYWRKQLEYPTQANQAAGTPPQIYNDTEALVYGTEFGAICGPSKVSFLFVNASDADRRAVSGSTDIFKSGNYYALSGEMGNTFTVCRPYSYLMAFHYGGGIGNGYDLTTGIGHLRGRWTSGALYAARLDYAVAANLNVFFTGAKGIQWNKSFGWGYVGLEQANATVRWATRRVSNANGALRSPAIPDDDLGWELGAGFDWKLLEGLLLNFQYSYWQPGNWWKYACVSRTNPSWKEGVFAGAAAGTAPIGVVTGITDTTLWGTNPNRAIDAIFGVNVMVVGEF
jgi:hypothetical protein